MALDIYAKQIPGIEIGRMGVATLLAFMNTVAATTMVVAARLRLPTLMPASAAIKK